MPLNPVFLGIAENVVLLLAVALVYDLASGGKASSDPASPWRRIGMGIVLGLIAVGTMMSSLRFEPGLIFDTRSVVLGIAGLFFGLAAALPAMLIAAIYRVLQGGTGMWTGLAVIATSGLLGVGWARLRSRPSTLGFRELYAFGLVLHLLVVGVLFTLPEGRALEIVPVVGPAMLLFYPFATVALGLLLVRRIRRDHTTTRLAESEARYRSLFEESHSILLIVDSDDGRIVRANPAAVQFYGYPRDRIEQMRITDINSLDESEMRAELARCIRGDRDRFQYTHRLADGSRRRVEVHCGPIPIEGRVLLLFTVHDVTEKHRTETALRQQSQVLRLRSAALEAAANPIIITNREGLIEWINPAFTRLTGYSAHEAIGSSPRDLIGSGQHDEDFLADLWDTILDGRVWRGEMINRRKDGSIYHEDQTITPVRNTDGTITHFIAIKQDLTERIELQEQLVQAQKMEAIGQLAGGVAHDFNNLLTVINGTAQLAMADVEPDTPLHRELDEILDAGDRAARLTRQLLTFSRREAVSARVVDLNEVIESTGDMLDRLLSDQILLDLRLSAEPARVLADPGRLEQILLNLALNAQDAMPDGGRITIETHVGTEVLLRVSDGGEGMAPEIQTRIFDPFFTTKPEGKGTGLGLATVYGIVTQAGGRITVDSAPGRGTRFEIGLPLAMENDSPAGSELPAQASPSLNGNGTGRQARILLVEDDEGIREVARRILERDGFEVVGADSGAAALDLLEQDAASIDMIMTDVVMPGMSGPELVARVHREFPGIRVLFSSGYTTGSLEEHGLDPADHPFLAKPFTVEDLTSRVRSLLTS